jgi:FlaA1/EpsC-like NDP-sugar epimerase
LGGRKLAALNRKRILVTGAGGFIGSALTRALVDYSPETLILLDIAEAGLHEISLWLGRESATHCVLAVGDVCDPDLLRHLFEQHRPQVVLHAAACKHVGLMEQNPFSAAKTNVLGSQQVAKAASAFGAEQLVLISTDKAVEPAGIMGATKRIAELIVLANRSATDMKAVRLGNVFGSTGSVVPILREQIARGGPLTITDPECERYFVSVDEAVRSLFLACTLENRAAVLVPQAEQALRMMDLVHELVTRSGLDVNALSYEFTGLRPGEKLKECLISEDETVADCGAAELRRVVSESLPTAEVLEKAIEEIAASIDARDLERLLRSVTSLLPRYQPSEFLRSQVGAAHARA